MKDERGFCLVKKSEVKIKKQHSPYYFEEGLLLMDAMTKLKVKKRIMRIKQAIQVGNNVTNIMSLPCIEKCVKRNDRHGMEWLEYVTTDCDIVERGDWLCETDEGKWMPMSNEEYKKFAKE